MFVCFVLTTGLAMRLGSQVRQGLDGAWKASWCSLAVWVYLCLFGSFWILDLCFSQAASLALLLPRPCTAGTWMKEAMRYGPSCCVGNVLKTNTACNKIDSQSNSYITTK